MFTWNCGLPCDKARCQHSRTLSLLIHSNASWLTCATHIHTVYIFLYTSCTSPLYTCISKVLTSCYMYMYMYVTSSAPSRPETPIQIKRIEFLWKFCLLIYLRTLNFKWPYSSFRAAEEGRGGEGRRRGRFIIWLCVSCYCKWNCVVFIHASRFGYVVFSSEWDAQRAIYSSDQERQLDGRYFEQIHRVFPFCKILPRVHSAHPIRGGGGGGSV